MPFEIRVDKPLISIPGHPPSLDSPPSGCRFASRCPFVADRCIKEEPALVELRTEDKKLLAICSPRSEFRKLAVNAETWCKDFSD